MIILVTLNILIILCIYFKYYTIKKSNENSNEISQMDFKNTDSLVLGYINDDGFNNNFDMILAEIINLNIKGFIKIEYTQDKSDKNNYVIKQNFTFDNDKIDEYELIILNYLFPKKGEITKKELEEKLENSFNTYDIQYNQIQEIIKRKVDKLNIIDYEKKRKLKKYTKIYKIFSIVMILLILFMKITIVNEMSGILILMYMFEKVVSYIMLKKANTYTENGIRIKEQVFIYKEELRSKKFYTNNSEMLDIVLNKEFADSLALHINTIAKEVFVYNKITENASKQSKKTIKYIFVGLVIALVAGFLLKCFTLIIPKDAIFWVYLILVLIIAGGADVTIALAQKKK